MRVALLACSRQFAASLEGYGDSHADAGARVVWTVQEPGSILAALDHEPDTFLLDMGWREKALQAAQTLKELGVPLIICLFERLDDPLIAEALAMGLDVMARPAAPGLRTASDHRAIS